MLTDTIIEEIYRFRHYYQTSVFFLCKKLFFNNCPFVCLNLIFKYDIQMYAPIKEQLKILIGK